MSELREKYCALSGVLDERQRRLWAATEARAVGRGGVAVVVAATGLSRITVTKALAELTEGAAEVAGPVGAKGTRRVRRAGGGRKRSEEKEPELAKALDALVEPTTRGDPMSALRWTSKSTRKLANELGKQGFSVSHDKVHHMLLAAGYSMQAPRKTREGSAHPDRDAQFEHINRTVEDMQARGQPVVSVDTKKKELVGDFKNGGREWQPEGKPEPVRVHDFLDPVLGKAIPYGTYDIGRNEGWVNVGIDHDTPTFAVDSISVWWRRMGKRAYPDATELLITADGGGSNASRSRSWKVELARFAEREGITIHVCHFPPGTSKWNKIEHRMFSHITENWRGRPLVTVETIVSLIAATTTRTGLRIRSSLDQRAYPTGIKVSDEELAALPRVVNEFHGEWNYSLLPR